MHKGNVIAYTALAVGTILLSCDYGSSLSDGLEEAPAPAQAAREEPPAPETVESLIDLGNKAVAAGRHEAALKAFSDAIKLRPNEDMLYVARAEIYFELGDTDLALTDLGHALGRSPDSIEIRQQRAYIYRRLERFAEAIEDLNYLIKLDPHNITACFNRASLSFELEDYAAAIADYDKCIATDPTLTSVYYNRAKAYAAMGNYDSAREDMKSFIEHADSENMKETAREQLKEWKDI